MSRTEQRRAAVFALYGRTVTNDPERGRVEDLRPFGRELVEGVERHAAELDKLIADHAIGWDLDRIAPLERSILRVALFEMRFRPDIPDDLYPGRAPWPESPKNPT